MRVNTAQGGRRGTPVECIDSVWCTMRLGKGTWLDQSPVFGAKPSLCGCH